MMTTATISTLVNDYATAISALDVDRYLANFADDALAYEPAGTPALIGKVAIRQFFENFTSLFERTDVQVSFVQQIGQEVAIKWIAHGVGKNGRAVTSEGIEIWKLNNAGKIQALHAYWNPEPLVAQVN